jgi:hypothetical protein
MGIQCGAPLQRGLKKNVAELANVTGPVIVGKRLERCQCHGVRLFVLLEEHGNEVAQVTEAFPQWGNADVKHIDAIEQVWAEVSCTGILCQVSMCGSD